MLAVVEHACNPSSGEMEAGGSEVRVHPQPRWSLLGSLSFLFMTFLKVHLVVGQGAQLKCFNSKFKHSLFGLF